MKLLCRNERLRAINQELNVYGIQIPKIGYHNRGEFELVNILYLSDFRPYFIDVTFSALMPYNGKIEKFVVRFYCGIGQLLIPIVNQDKLLLSYQHRLPVFEWKFEFPRSFANVPKDIACGPVYTYIPKCNELDSLFMVYPNTNIESIECIDKYENDTGSTHGYIYYFLLNISVPDFDSSYLEEKTKKNIERIKIKSIDDFVKNRKTYRVSGIYDVLALFYLQTKFDI